MSVVVAQRLYLPMETERRITGWIDAYKHREKPTDRSPTRLILFGPADCGQRGVIQRIATATGLPMRPISLAAWRTQAPGRRLQAVSTWAPDTPSVIMLRPDPWLIQPNDLLQTDPWWTVFLEWVDSVPAHSWVILRTPDRPHAIALRRRFDDILGIPGPNGDSLIDWAITTLDPSSTPARVNAFAQLMAGFSWGDVAWAGHMAHRAWEAEHRHGSPLDYLGPAINARQQLLRDT